MGGGEAALSDLAETAQTRVPCRAVALGVTERRDGLDEGRQWHVFRVVADAGTRALRWCGEWWGREYGGKHLAAYIRRYGDNQAYMPRMRFKLRDMTDFKVSEAARLLAVSDDTVRRWIDQDLLQTTDATPTRISGAALAERALAHASTADDPTDMLSSARNRFVGIVTRLQVDGVMAQVDIQAGPHRVVSLMSAEAVGALDLEVGSLAVAVVKATTVIVETSKAHS